MASSGYYYSRYKFYLSEENKYKRWIEQLVDIRDAFGKYAVRKNSDEVNRQISRSKSFMEGGLSGRSAYYMNCNTLESSKEPQSDADGSISSSKGYIQREINSVIEKRDYADDRKDYFYRKYQEAKKAEAAARC